jgi:stage II sporulation protein M
MNGITKNEHGKNELLFAAAFFILSCGIIIGSIYLSKINTEAVEKIKEYLDNFIQSGVESDCFAVFKSAARENLISFAVIFIAGFFKIGAIFSAAAVIRKGFVIGFTASSFIKIYGLKGLAVMAATMPVQLITLPTFLFLAAMSVKFAVSGERRDKKSLASYIAFSLVILLLFSIAALAEGYLTTNFMRLILPKIG